MVEAKEVRADRACDARAQIMVRVDEALFVSSWGLRIDFGSFSLAVFSE